MATQDQAAEGGESYVIFRLGEEEYGLPIGAVEEVVNLPDRLPRLPRSPDFVAGVMSLRGKVVPVVEQRRRFGVHGAAPVGRRRVIVTTIGNLRAGFVVDQVSEILQLPEERLRPTPELAADAGRLFDRIAELEGGGRMILLVNPQQLLDRAEAEMLAALSEAAATPGP
jgi:purine-binding chemotaxis protein CheW